MSKHNPGKWRFLYNGHYGSLHYYVRRIGTVQVADHGTDSYRNPSGKRWHLVCWGMNFDTPEQALEYAIKTWDMPYDGPEHESKYAQMERLMIGPGRFEQE